MLIEDIMPEDEKNETLAEQMAEIEKNDMQDRYEARESHVQTSEDRQEIRDEVSKAIQDANAAIAQAPESESTSIRADAVDDTIRRVVSGSSDADIEIKNLHHQAEITSEIQRTAMLHHGPGMGGIRPSEARAEDEKAESLGGLAPSAPFMSQAIKSMKNEGWKKAGGDFFKKRPFGGGD